LSFGLFLFVLDFAIGKFSRLVLHRSRRPKAIILYATN
jgi:hypothetical protein